MATNNSTFDSSSRELGPLWQTVREYSSSLALFGAVFSSVPCVLSIGGNILLLVVIMKFPQLRDVQSNFLLASLATSDLLIGLLVQPLHGMCALTSEKCPSLFGISPAVFFYFLTVVVISSCLNITIMAVERYIFIVESLRYQSIVTKTRVIQAIFIGWVISAVFPLTRLIPSFPMIAIRVLQFILISSILVVLIFCYMKIFCIHRRYKRQIISRLQAVVQGPRTQEIFRSANTVFLVVGAVFISYTPLLIAQFLLNFNHLKHHVRILHPFAVTFFLLNSSVNPLIIFFRSRKLRRFLRKLFKCKT